MSQPSIWYQVYAEKDIIEPLSNFMKNFVFETTELKFCILVKHNV